MINSFDSKERENEVNSFTKRSTVCYGLIELILQAMKRVKWMESHREIEWDRTREGKKQGERERERDKK